MVGLYSCCRKQIDGGPSQGTVALKSLKKNLNTSKPSELSKDLGGDIGFRGKISSWY